MRCAEFEHRLNDLLDERAAPEADAALRLHADECDRCREKLADQELLLTGLALWEPPALPSDFSRRVVAAYRQEESTPTPVSPAVERPAARWPLWLVGVLATGLVALVAVGVDWWTRHAPGGPPTIVKQPTPVNPQPERPAPQLVDRKPAPAPLPAAPIPAVPSGQEVALQEFLGVVQEQFPEMNPERGTEFASQVVDGLRPLATPVGDVFNVLRRTISGSKDQSMRPRKPQASSLLAPERGLG